MQRQKSNKKLSEAKVAVFVEEACGQQGDNETAHCLRRLFVFCVRSDDQVAPAAGEKLIVFQ